MDQGGCPITESDPLSDATPIVSETPSRRSVRMSMSGPLEQLVMYLMIHAVEDLLGDTRPVVVRPASDDRVEVGDERHLGLASMFLNYFFDPALVVLLSFPTRLDEGFEPRFIPEGRGMVFLHRELPDGEAKEVKPCLSIERLERVTDMRFLGFQS
jgi:hypothetical protein